MRVYEQERTDRDQLGINASVNYLVRYYIGALLHFRGSDVSTEISTSLMNDFDDFVVFCAFSI